METAKFSLRFNGAYFYIDGEASFALPGHHGFRFHEEKRTWYTSDYKVAARLREYASAEAEKALSKAFLSISPWVGRVPRPVDLTPLPFQIPAAKFSLSRNRSYQYAAPGMGKTIIASLIMNGWASRAPTRFVYICPPFLARNVENELDRWSPHIGAEHYARPTFFGSLMLLPSTILTRAGIFEDVKSFLSDRQSVLVVDEAHQFKNSESDRTRALFGHPGKVPIPALADLFQKQVYMSGSAMPNRPLELFPVLSYAAPETIDFMDRDAFGLKYCAGHYDGYGYDFSGASNMQELAAKVQGTFMYRLKKDLLKLPPLTEEVFVVADDLKPEVMRFESAILKRYDVEDLMKGKLEAAYQHQGMHLMTYQRLLGLEKVKHALDWCEDLFENTDDVPIIFARHKDVLKAIYEGLHRAGLFPILIDAEVPKEHRFELIQQFQKSPKRRPLIGSLRTMGLGFNATRANRVLHVEPDWTPTTNDQGSDRAHRYGQTRSVFAQYMCHQNSIDKKVLETILRKRKLASYL